MKGEWKEKVFQNDNPITLELGCGKGEYSVALGRMYPERNFIGVDIKGHRFWRGAKTAHEEGMKNVAFLRTRIEFIAQFFEKGEVEDIWLTFSDPQPKDEKGSKRLTSPKFIDRYKQFLEPGKSVHVKTDSSLLYDYTMEELERLKYEIEVSSDDVHGELVNEVDEQMAKILSVRTHYETIWSEKGRNIKYIRFKV
ncbi:MAG: tRNA (guanosine(46)-N7)-methyltransferase TrmB [Flavobacteriales bacterium]|nr:tRNA (guanosine(46)-N7)-methyltransferase TrmB [Flavobacteriales bacterium]